MNRKEESDMSTTIHAVYTNGVLRPVTPLSLTEGDKVELTIAQVVSEKTNLAEVEMIKRIQACKNYDEWLQLTRQLPSDDGGYYIEKALEENRRWSGEHGPAEERKP
jgi:predicted DNA-binding antitoxin AbrB/MazE fold protein